MGKQLALGSLSLVNFRSHRDTTIRDLGSQSVFGGRNASGKSSILDAIAFALTGTCRGADSGRGLIELRTTGSRSRAVVAFTGVVDGKTITFTRAEDEGPRSAKQDALRDLLGIPPATIRACLYSSEILRMDRKDAQRMILDLVASDGVTLSPEIQASLASYGLGSINAGLNEPQDLAAIEALYKRAFEARRERGVLLRGLGEATTAPERPEWLGPKVDGENLGTVRKQIAEKVEALRRQRAAAGRDHDEAYQTYQRDRDARAMAKDRLTRLKEVPVRSLDVLSAECKAALAELERVTSESKAWNDKAEEAQKAVAVASQQLEALKAERIRFAKLGGDCPACRQKIAQAKREKYLAQLDEAIAVREREHEAARATWAEYRTAPDFGVQQVNDLCDALEIEDRQRAEILAEILACEKALEDPEPVKPEVPESFVELVNKINVGEERLQALDNYMGAAHVVERAAERRKTLEDDLAGLETLVAYLGPGGEAREKLGAGGGVDNFAVGIAADLDLMGFTLDLKPLMDLKDDPFVNGRPARMLSDSERLRFGLAFAMSVATWSGLKLVTIDAWETLREDAAKQAMQVVANFQGQVLIFTTPQNADAFAEAGRQGLVKGPRFFLVSSVDGVSAVEPLAGVAA